jgi:lantibiotic modifying enzyme
MSEENEETFGDAIDLLKDHPDLLGKFYKNYPHLKKQVQEEIKEREDVEEFLKKLDSSF